MLRTLSHMATYVCTYIWKGEYRRTGLSFVRDCRGGNSTLERSPCETLRPNRLQIYTPPSIIIIVNRFVLGRAGDRAE